MDIIYSWVGGQFIRWEEIYPLEIVIRFLNNLGLSKGKCTSVKQVYRYEKLTSSLYGTSYQRLPTSPPNPFTRDKQKKKNFREKYLRLVLKLKLEIE